jgi:cytochrome c
MKQSHYAILFSVLLFTLSFNNKARADDLEFGEYLASQCTTCHQLSGENKGIPSIVGWDKTSFVAVMNAYKTKERENEAMQNIAGSLNGEEIVALAAFFSSLPIPREN